MNPRLTRRTWLLATLAPVLRLAAQSHQSAAARPKPEQVLKELRDGNQRFVKNHLRHPHDSPQWALRTAREGQHPIAAILCCSDSRVSPELVFDQGIGDLFVVRVAGNVANEDEIASIEYATSHLGVPLVVVLGHAECGAVSAVVNHEELPRELQHLTAHIGDAFARVQRDRPDLRGTPLIEATVRANVSESIQDMLRDGELLARASESGSIRILGAVYDLASGRVEWLP